MKIYKNVQSTFRKGIKWYEEKFSKSRGKGHQKTEMGIFNHPRRDSQVRSGKK
jgi:hypothetical protein